jgi:alkanesulfonate monooxygenase SsuD/methylene tetrahydromethanopterin reductase-like flavin-dependent oxidoreductase (luciferase family)
MFCESFCSCTTSQQQAIYRNNFQPSEQLKEPYVVACVNVIAADSDKEAARLATSFKRLFLGILTGNRQQLKEAVDPGEGFMDPMEEAALQHDCLYFYRWTGKVKKELDYFIEKLKLTN